MDICRLVTVVEIEYTECACIWHSRDLPLVCVCVCLCVRVYMYVCMFISICIWVSLHNRYLGFLNICLVLWQPNGNRNRGRPAHTYRWLLEKDTGLCTQELRTSMLFRTNWRHHVMGSGEPPDWLIDWLMFGKINTCKYTCPGVLKHFTLLTKSW